MTRAGRSVAFLVAMTGIWLAGVGLASADPSSSPSTPATPVSPLPASPPSSPTAPSPTPTSSATGTASDPPSVTATFSGFCDDFGWEVKNSSTAPVTVHVEVNGKQVGAAVVVPPGATVHVPLDPNTEPASEVQLVDAQGNVIDSQLIRFCISVINRSVTIRANTSYTLGPFLDIQPMVPNPRHGVVVHVTGPSYPDKFLRYIPDPCFAGTDTFGYKDFVVAVQGVVTVTVLPGACRVSVHRSTTDCATKTVKYTATNPYALPAHLVESNSANPGSSKDLVVPAHRTAVISTVTLTGATSHAQVSFPVRDTSHTVLTDDVSFSCPPPAAPNNAGSALPATGAAPTQLAAWGAASIALGAVIMWLVRPRRAAARPHDRTTTPDELT